MADRFERMLPPREGNQNEEKFCTAVCWHLILGASQAGVEWPPSVFAVVRKSGDTTLMDGMVAFSCAAGSIKEFGYEDVNPVQDLAPGVMFDAYDEDLEEIIKEKPQSFRRYVELHRLAATCRVLACFIDQNYS